MDAQLRLIEPSNVNRSVRRPPGRATNADLRPREYLTPDEVEKLRRPPGAAATVTATRRLSSLPFGTACGPPRFATSNGRKSNSVAPLRCMYAGPRMASRAFILSVATNCAPCASYTGSFPTAPLCSPPSAAARSRRTLSIGLSSASASGPAFLPGALPHAAPRLRLCAGECGPRHARNSGLAWASLNSAYRALHRANADAVQRFLALKSVVLARGAVSFVPATHFQTWPLTGHFAETA